LAYPPRRIFPFAVPVPHDDDRNAWSRSGAREAPERCKVILQRMEDLYFAGRTELQPDTISFNTALDCFAQSRYPDSAWDAEQLLDYMEQLSAKDERLRDTCRPDIQSFNSVLNVWARSRHPMAADRADAILQHMEQRYDNGNVTFPPDLLSYNTVLAAWARSKNNDRAIHKAEQILHRMELSYRNSNVSAVPPNTISYNTVMNALAQSNDPNAENRARKLLERMKKLDSENGLECCRPDCVTYTTLITLMGKKATQQNEYAEMSIRLLEELEELYTRTKDAAFQPNIRIYTAVR
jgi:Pentatricopeptide repeat domain